MATETNVRTHYEFDLRMDDIVLQKVTVKDVTSGRGRDHAKSGRDCEDILHVTPTEVARLIESGADCLRYLLKTVASDNAGDREDAFHVLGIKEGGA